MIAILLWRNRAADDGREGHRWNLLRSRAGIAPRATALRGRDALRPHSVLPVWLAFRVAAILPWQRSIVGSIHRSQQGCWVLCPATRSRGRSSLACARECGTTTFMMSDFGIVRAACSPRGAGRSWRNWKARKASPTTTHALVRTVSLIPCSES